MNIVKIIRHELGNCNGYYVARRNVNIIEHFLENLEKMLDETGIGIRALSGKLNVSNSNAKLLLAEEIY